MLRTGRLGPRCSPVAVAAVVLLAATACGQDGSVPVTAPEPETVTVVTTVDEEGGAPDEQAEAPDRPDPRGQPESTGCDLDSAVSEAIAGFRPTSLAPDRGWVLYSKSEGCPTLGYAEITIEGATGSSPTQLLLFHRDRFLGTGVRCDILGQVVGETDDSVTVEYRWAVGDEPNALMSGRADVTFQWDGSRVQMLDPLPEAAKLGNSC